jgi:hypothetical protein
VYEGEWLDNKVLLDLFNDSTDCNSHDCAIAATATLYDAEIE